MSSVTEVLLRLLSASFALVIVLICSTPAEATSTEWQPPAAWLREAACVHHYEGSWDAATGNGYEGGLQFLRSTWMSVGGPVDANGHWASVVPPREQLFRAWLVWKRDGGSWREWGTARDCGLT
jgi:hypothetical protein